MTMTMTSSQFGLEDMEALLWGPSSPMVETMDLAFLHPDKNERQEGGGGSPPGHVSPLASSALSSSSSTPPFYSPPPSPPALDLGGDKAGTESELLPLSWLDHPVQPRSSQMVSGDSKDDALSDLDWMAERVDLSDFDLDSLIGSCSPVEDAPSSPEDLLASLDCPMELDSFPLPTLSSAPSASFAHVPSVSGSDPSVTAGGESESLTGGQEVPSSPLLVPEPQEELEVKSEPASPGPSPCVVDSPSSPAFTLDLGSEVDISESEVDISESEVDISESEVKPVVASVVPQVPKIVLSLSPTRIVLVLTPKNDVGVTPAAAPRSPPASPPQKSPRSRPYPDPKNRASPPSPTTDYDKSVRAAGGTERSTSKAPRDKKQKKMEQNKTAATRYRQKKRAEQDALLVEHAQLERKNVELTEKAESMAREIEYLKELMEEVRQTRLKKGLSADP
ncbi:PREDICTED: cyclic AMP-dependent transcription factor ATF-4-like isoform X1 [Poecilia mexicana]|uniref:Cyclic AMP-dependent transcription factor ATF-4 n=1 Tax=Poecilia mexicana TaxID=48701 RepID=A0A3B3YWC6_9TELE|nr:PREDICTED: cyclic AMP-dependent transcription factor ATF-4-like isoform X1 [Poecilia mexicana]